jgi:DUF4097 and DUF4098 domain-containing protein YvlB
VLDRPDYSSIQAKPKQAPPKVRWTRAWVLLLPLGFAGAGGPLHFDRMLETTASPRVSLSNLKGHVVVKGWDKSAVHVTSTSVSPEIEVDVEQYPSTGAAEKVHFTTHVLSNQTGDKSTDYTLEVPLDSSLEIRNPEGSVRIERLHGEASVDTVGGAISVSEESGHLAVRSIGGNIEIVRPSGRVEANSICGSVRIVNPSSARLRAVTTSGKIFYEGDFLPGGEYELSNYSGDTEILTPQSASFELNAKTVRGKVVADPDIALTPKRHTAFRPLSSNSLFGTHNAGKATLELTSFSGTIRIRRLP